MCSYSYLKVLKMNMFLENVNFRDHHTSPVRLCRSCRRHFFFLEKHTPEFYEHVLCGFCDVLAILESPGKVFKIWPLCSNDYASKTCIEILCKKTCCIAPHLFPKPHLLANSRKYRTLTIMST